MMNKKYFKALLSVMAAVLAFCIVTVSVLVCLDVRVYGVETALSTTDITTDEAPATEPPATEPPATEPPATEPLATEPPATEPPVTEPPVTDPTTTEPPVTEPPVTGPTTTEPPITGPVGATAMAFENETDIMARGETKKQNIIPTPAGAELPELTFASSDETVATVDGEGNVTTLVGGVVTITASNSDGTMTCSCTITVLFSDIKLKTLENTGEKVVSGFSVGMTIGDVRDDIAAAHSVDRETVTVTDKDKNPLGDAESIRSGAYLTVEGVEYMAVLYGDVTGDGLITTDDTQLILDYITGASGISQRACLFASDLLGNGEITVECALIIQRHVFNIQLITQ